MSKILLHVGFPKAASTFLGYWFHKNPYFIFNDFALGGFNNTEGLMNFSVSDDFDDKKIFVVRDMRFSSPDFNDFKNLDNIEDFQQRVAMTLYSLFPKAKVLIVTRGFESAIKAKYSQYLKEGGFIKFNKYFERGKNSKWLPFNYSFFIKVYSDLFGIDNVCILPFELLKVDQSQFLRKIEHFLEIGHFDYKPEKTNQSLSPQNMTFIRKMNKIMHVILFIFGPFQFLFYKLYVKALSTQKNKSWNSSLISKLMKPLDFNCYTIDELAEKFSFHAQALKDNAEYQDFKKEYFIDYPG